MPDDVVWEEVVWEEVGEGWRGTIGDVVFLLDYRPPSGADVAAAVDGTVLSLFKPKHIVDQYGDFLRRSGLGGVGTLLELGIWEGGSVAFWNEVLHPQLHLAVDIKESGESDALKRYLNLADRRDRIKTYWGVDQSDTARLRALLQENDVAGLDLVIDDASHRHALTKASFEFLFPLVRSGGYYIIEDWSWAYMPEYRHKSHLLAGEPSPAELLYELAEMVASFTRSEGMATSMTVFPSFVAVERGGADAPADFRVSDLITRREAPGPLRTAYTTARRTAGRLVRERRTG